MSIENEEKQIQDLAGKEVTFIIPNTEELGVLERMEPAFDIRLRYKMEADWKQIANVPVKCYFMGLKIIPDENGNDVLCGLFASKKEIFLTAATVIITAVRNLPLKTPIQITYIDNHNNKKNEGSTMIFDVQLLQL